MPKKLVPAIEEAFSVAFMAAVGGIAFGAAGTYLMLGFLALLQPLDIPIWLLVMIAFLGVFFVVAAIVNALIHDDRVTKTVESTFPLSPEEIKERLRSRGGR